MAGRRGSTFIRVVVDNAGANRNLDQTEKKVRGLGPAARLAAGVVVAAFGAMATAIAGSIGPAAEFQTGLAEIATLSEDAKSSIGAIGDSVKEVAVTFGQDLKDSTKAAYDAISAGIPTKEVGNFLKTAARAATGGLVDIATSVDVLTTSVNAWAKENLTAERASDILFSVVQRGKTTYEQLAGSLSNVANIAAAADISLEEVGAAVASLTSQGVPTSEAMTQIRGAVQGLIRDTPELISAFNQAGFASGEAAIRALGFGGAAQIVARSANGSLGAIQKMVGSVEGMNAVLGVTGSNLDLFNENLEATRRSAGVSERAFNQLANTFEFQRRRVMQGFQLLRVELGSLFLPVLTEVAKVIANFFGVAADSSDEEGEQTKSQFERIKEAVMGVSDSFGTLLEEIGKFTKVTGVFDPLVAAWEAAKDALGLSGPLFSAEDLLPADTSLAGWVEALGFEIRQALTALTDVLKNQTLKNFVTSVAAILVSLFSGAVSFATAGKAFGRLLLDVFRDAIPGLKMSFKNAVLVDLLTDLESIITAYLGGQVEWKTASAAFRTVITDVFTVAADKVKEALAPATTAIGDFLTVIEEKFPNATRLIKNIAGAVATLAANVKSSSPTWTEFRDGFTQAFTDKVGQIAENVATLAGKADELGGKLAKELQPAFQWIKDNLPTIDARFAGVAAALGAFAVLVRFFNPLGASLGVIIAALATDWSKLNAEVVKLADEHGLAEIWADIEKSLSDAAMTIRNFLQPVADVGDYAGNAAVDLNSLVLALKGFNAQQAPFDVLIGAFNRLGASISTNQEVMEIINERVLPPFRAAWQELVYAWEDNKEEILLLVTALTALAVGALTDLIRGVGGVIRILGGLVRIVRGTLGVFKALWQFLTFDWAGGMETLRNSLGDISEGFIQVARGLGPAILAALTFIPWGRGIAIAGRALARLIPRGLIGRAVAAIRKYAPRIPEQFEESVVRATVAVLESAPARWIRGFVNGVLDALQGIRQTGFGRFIAGLFGAELDNAGAAIRVQLNKQIRGQLKAIVTDVKKFNFGKALLRVIGLVSLAQLPIAIANALVPDLDSVLSGAREQVGSYFSDLGRQANVAWDQWWSGPFIGRAREVFAGLGTDIEEIEKNWQASSLGRLASWSMEQRNNFDQWRHEVRGNFLAWAGETLPIVDDWSVEQLDKFYDWQNQVSVNFNAWVDEWTAAFKGWLANTLPIVDDWSVEQLDKFYDWQNEVLLNFLAWVQEWSAAFAGWAAENLAAFGQWALDTLYRFDAWQNEQLQKLRDWSSNALNVVRQWIDDAIRSLTGGGIEWEKVIAAALVAILFILTRGRIRNLAQITAMVAGVTLRFNQLRTAVLGIWNSIVSAIGSGAGRIRSYVDGAIAGVRRLIQAARDAARAVKDVPVVGGVAGAIANVLPSFQGGGIVPGRLGQPVPILAHGGEEVLTPEQRRNRGGDTYYVTNQYISGSLIAERDVDNRVNSAGRRNQVNRPNYAFA
ncbi:MAG: phage tail tape measure protein [Gammaproteobacteria bacterium]|nr:phage tail tape measure protein [Gammaproteobacteria bacterium]